MDERKYTVGIMEQDWGGDDVQTLTFIVTEDCNLRCKYCYITHKSKGKVLSLETAKKFIDYVLTAKRFHRCRAVILDFIGGEPLLEAELISDICDYFKIRAYEEQLPWYWNYRINISTNGVNYSDQKVQELIKKNEGKISIGITIDGTKEKHDLQRVFPDGSGSYDIIHKNLDLWKSQFAANTKVTFASEDLKYLKESIIHLWNEGIYDVAANVVFENVWKDGDDEIFEKQLVELADYIVENELYDKYYCTLFLDNIGMPYKKEDMSNTSCGAGKIIALSPNGNLYPCIRYYDYSLNNKKGYVIGNVKDGIDYEKVRAFLLAMYKYQCDEECLECSIASGCAFCQGFNYDEADTETNFQKAKYICKMHKARVRANNYYFAKLYHKTGIYRQGFVWKNELNFVLSDRYVSGCSYNNENKSQNYMTRECIRNGLDYAKKFFMKPIFWHSAKLKWEEIVEYEDVEILHMLPIEAYREGLPFKNIEIIVSDKAINEIEKIPFQNNIILNISQNNIENLYLYVEKLLEKSNRININIQNLSEEFEMEKYKEELFKCVKLLVSEFEKSGKIKEINLITDLLLIDQHEGCLAGINSYTYAPDEKFYICPAFYSENSKDIGNLQDGIQIKNQHLFSEKYMPLCNMCDTYQCENCKFINKKYTKEVNVSPSFQCVKAHIERDASYTLQEILKDKFKFLHILEKIKFSDPIKKLNECNMFEGYYV